MPMKPKDIYLAYVCHVGASWKAGDHEMHECLYSQQFLRCKKYLHISNLSRVLHS